LPITQLNNMNTGKHPKTINCARLIEEDNNLLALPKAIAQIVELAAKDEASIDNLSDIISTDAALAGRLLKIANSPYYGLSRRVVSIHQATMVLGTTTVKCLALSAAIFDISKLPSEAGLDIEAYYGNIISVATTCRKLALECGYPAPEEAFTCGLLYDIGTLYFIHHFPEKFGSVILRVAEDGNIIDEEINKFGIAHPEASRLIAEKWRLPQNMISAISNHYNCGNRDSKVLDDILRLSVALNREIISQSDQYIEDKITKISIISDRLCISVDKLNEITTSTMKEAIEFARLIDVNMGDFESILSRANNEIFKTYLSIQRLFKQRQELTGRILHEERERGLLEAKHIAVSTLAHYINNASMQISGQSQIVRMSLKKKNPEEIVAQLPRILNNIDDAINKIVAVLEEISEMSLLDNMEYFDKSKILNIDERIKTRLDALRENSHGIILPAEAEAARKS
jgi:HD-like signal output (HDOD) protein